MISKERKRKKEYCKEKRARIIGGYWINGAERAISRLPVKWSQEAWEKCRQLRSATGGFRRKDVDLNQMTIPERRGKRRVFFFVVRGCGEKTWDGGSVHYNEYSNRPYYYYHLQKKKSFFSYYCLSIQWLRVPWGRGFQNEIVITAYRKGEKGSYDEHI